MRNMMRWVIAVACCITISAQAQKTYPFEDFSDLYRATLVVDDKSPDEISSDATVNIMSKEDEALLLSVRANDVIPEFDSAGKVVVNVQERPYGQQSLIIFEDVNFDGRDDLAIQDGHNSCYGGPSFQIYLQSDEGLSHSPEFTRLAQEYCGMFGVDTKEQKLTTMTKSGCCWHEFSEFKVVDNTPVPVSVVVEDLTTTPFITVEETLWKDGKKTHTVTRLLDLESGITRLFSFKLLGKRKSVFIFMDEGKELRYAFFKQGVETEFYYPENTQGNDFTLGTQAEKLVFTNNGVTYTVYEKWRDGALYTVGVSVKTQGKTYDLKGNVATVEGSLKKLRQHSLKNLATQ